MKLKINIALFISGIIFLSVSCERETTITPSPTPTLTAISISHKVDKDNFMLNNFMYKTQAGYTYNITKLVYYISQISLLKTDSTSLVVKDYQYVDANIPETNEVILKNVPPGNYVGIKFNLGLDSLHNISDTLLATTENINMQWPQFMGGGYHFMKLEGNFKDSSGTYGYAMHLGTNNCLVPIKLYKNIIILKNAQTPITLVMNVNEWFRNPHTFDFNKDGNYIMGNSSLMKKIAENGIDVFSF